MSQLEQLVARMKEALGSDWVAAELAQMSGTHDGDSPFYLIDWLHTFEGWRDSSFEGDFPGERETLTRLFHHLLVISYALNFRRSDAWRRELRDAAHSGDDAGFRNILFEAETAFFFGQQEGTSSVSFGPYNGRPDLWVTLNEVGGKRDVPVECKRIQPKSRRERQFSDLQASLREELTSSIELDSAIKVGIRIRYPFAASATSWIIPEISRLIDRAKQENESVITGEARQGLAQITIEIHEGSEPRIEELKIQTDAIWNRVGQLDQNVRTATNRQLATVATKSEPGWVAIRIRPPQGLGDLYEAETTVRPIIEPSGRDHLELVALFWDEMEDAKRLEGPESGAEGTEHEESGQRIEMRSRLRGYYCVDCSSGLYRSMDSFDDYFEEQPEILVRDPNSGQLVGVDQDHIRKIEALEDVPDKVLDGLIESDEWEQMSEESGEATMYFATDGPLLEELRDSEGGLVGVIPIGNRQFRVYLVPGSQLRVIEFRSGRPVGVATVELDAWEGMDDFGVVVQWRRDSFTVEPWKPDESERLEARSSDVPKI